MMSARLHDDEPDTGATVVRGLLRTQCPQLADLPLEQVTNTGTDNALYRLGTSLVVRLPRTVGAARSLTAEVDWLPRLTARLPVAVPELVHVGTPARAYPYPWAVLTWLDGADAWATREHEVWFGPELGAELAQVVLELRSIPVDDAPRRESGTRGGSLAALDDRVRWWLADAQGLVDVPAVTRVWDPQTWTRGRGFVLEHAIGGIVYYTRRRHPLADVMRRSLDRLLAGR